ncbi:MAG: hypothetical protein P8Y72_03915 [Anaerolineales bacterium]
MGILKSITRLAKAYLQPIQPQKITPDSLREIAQIYLGVDELR